MNRLSGRLRRLERRRREDGGLADIEATVREIGLLADWLRKQELTAAEALKRGLRGPEGLRHFSLAEMAEVEGQVARYRRMRVLECLDQAERRLREAEDDAAALRREDTGLVGNCRESVRRQKSELGLAEGQSFADLRSEYEALGREQAERDERSWGGVAGPQARVIVSRAGPEAAAGGRRTGHEFESPAAATATACVAVAPAANRRGDERPGHHHLPGPARRPHLRTGDGTARRRAGGERGAKDSRTIKP